VQARDQCFLGIAKGGIRVDNQQVATDEVVQSLIEAWSLMTGRFAGSSALRGAGMTATMSHTVCPFFNMIIQDQPLRDAAAFGAAIEAARGHAADCAHGSMVATCSEWNPAEGQAIAEAKGMAAGMTITGMAADALLPPRRAEPALTFRFVDDAATGGNLGSVNALAYGMDPALFAPMADMALWQRQSFGVVGYDGETAVTAAAAFATPAMIYIAMVASLPGTHGRGYAEAAMRRAIAAAEAAAGPKRLWLHASEMGRPLYTAMGFATGAVLQTWHFA
jgi:GNAT superfamily N-acetyltransferase